MKTHKFFLSNTVLAVIILLLGFSLWYSYNHIQLTISSTKLVNHTNLVDLKIEEALSAVKDAETGQRGFLITSDSVFLQAEFNTEKKETEILHQLDSLVSDNKIQAENLSKYRKLIFSRFDYLKTTRDYRFEKRTDSSRLRFYMLNEKRLMDSVGAQADKMEKVEQILLQQRTRQNEKNIVITPIITLSVSFILLGIIITGFFMLRHRFKELEIMKDKMLQTNEELKNKNKELEAFTYIASHDLQEPLRKIQTFSHKILDKEAEFASDQSRDYFKRILSATARMQALINALFSYSHLSKEGTKYRRINLNDIIDEIKENLYDLIEERNAEIYAKDLPVIYAEPIQVYQLFSNLIGNSIKYSKKDIPPVIKISAELIKNYQLKENVPSNDYWKIIVEDNGIGFDPVYKEKIFDLFGRLHLLKDYPGTGIGLTICKKVVENHNGIITAEGAPGKGATFFIFIPETQPDE